ncbi:hypothetical protein GC163_13190 [bacterium]|nr:hypothetical protein [bacterium]
MSNATTNTTENTTTEEIIKDKLTNTEQREAVKLERQVEGWQTGYRDAGHALSALQDGTLFVGTWTDYIGRRFDLSYMKGYRLISAAKVADQLEELGFEVLPLNEGQAFELSSVGDQLKAVWSAVIEAAGSERPTMSLIMETKRKLLGGVAGADKNPVRPLLTKLDGIKRSLKGLVEDKTPLDASGRESVRRRLAELSDLMAKLTAKAAEPVASAA